jgi:hypothetical protein
MRLTPLFALALIAVAANASQPLETESARLLPAGVAKIEATTEFQTSSAGRERAFPIAFEYGFTSHLELAIEPVPRAVISPCH